jgi:replication factor C subunit 1
MNLIDKYKPKKSNYIVGQYYGVKNLKDWLLNWSPKQKHKAVLISGQCGVGKSLSVELLCNELKYNKIELNNSNILTKENLKKLITNNQNNKSIDSFFKKLKKELYVFDEIDCFYDKGALNEINNIIKNTKVPIILICNEIIKELRTISNNCFQVKFFKNKPEKLVPFISNIAEKEKIKLNTGEINDLIIEHNSDIRSIINYLNINCNSNSKDRQYNNYFESTKLYFNKQTTFQDRDKIFFSDYFMVPLFLQENYINYQNIESIEQTSNTLSQIDTYGTMNFELLPTISTIFNLTMSQNTTKKFSGKVNFPSYLGNFSKLNKNLNLFSTIERLDLLPSLNIILYQTLEIFQKEGISKVIKFMKDNKINKEKRDLIGEICLKDFDIPTKLKSAFTRELNKI